MQGEVDTVILERIKNLYEFNYTMLFNRDNALQKHEIESQIKIANQFLFARLKILEHQRKLLIKFQTEGSYDEEALIKAEREIDIEELQINSLTEKTEASAKAANDVISG